MGRTARSCTQSLLKAANYGLGLFGVAMIVYAVWMFRVWLRDRESDHAPTPWFTYTVLGLGLIVCLITCLGHFAAETATDVFLNSHWEEDFPDDPTENLDKLKDFFKNNLDICKWIGFTVVALQGLSIILAIILKALGPHPVMYYESDDDYPPDRAPLLHHYVPPQSYVGHDQFGSKKRFSDFENQQ